MKKPVDYILDEIEKLHEIDQPYFDDDDVSIYDGNSEPIFKAIKQAQIEAVVATLKRTMSDEHNIEFYKKILIKKIDNYE